MRMNKKKEPDKGRIKQKNVKIFAENENFYRGHKKYKSTQLTFTCLKSTIETLQTGVKYVQS